MRSGKDLCFFFSLTDYTDNTDFRNKDFRNEDFRNKDFRIEGLRGFNRSGMNRIEVILRDLIGLG